MAAGSTLIERLNDILRLEHDAERALEEARHRLASEPCRETLTEIQKDHRAHEAALREAIEALGGAAEPGGDMRGRFLRGLTALRALAGDEMALKAARLDERLLLHTLEDALEVLVLPPDVRALLRRQLEEEREHLNRVQKALDERLWEPEEAPPS